MAMDLAQFHEMFVAESDELLTHAQAVLSAAARGETGSDEVAELGRCMHSIKGGGQTFGFDDLAALAGVCEELLVHVRMGRVRFDDSIVGGLLAAVLALRRQLSVCCTDTRKPGATPDAGHWRRGKVREGRAEVARCVPAEQLPDDDSGLQEVYFRLSRAVCSDVLVDDMLEELGRLGELLTVDRPQVGGHGGEWRIDIATRHREAAIRKVLDRVAEPGSLRVARGGARGHGAEDGRERTLYAGNGPYDRAQGEAMRTARQLTHQCAGLAVHVEEQVVVFADLLGVVERGLASNAMRADPDELMEALRRVDRTMLQGERLVERFGAIADALCQVLDTGVAEAGAARQGDRTGDLLRGDEQVLRSRPRTARISPSGSARRRLGAPLPKVKRADGPTNALDDEWEMLL